MEHNSLTVFSKQGISYINSNNIKSAILKLITWKETPINELVSERKMRKTGLQ